MPLVYQEIHGDLFTAASTTSLAHCVSRDMHMGKGIATLFRDKFGQINELKKQGTNFVFYSFSSIYLLL
jgi:hypothetical protein